jgi:hypothetical protein
MNIRDKMLNAYFKVAEKMDKEPDLLASTHYFHRTKKLAFVIKALRLDKTGLLPGEREAGAK